MKKQIRMIIVGLVCVALVVGYYYHLSHRSTKTAEDTTELTAITKITTKNLDTSYPQTPREVIKLYNDILKCYYNEDCTEDEIRALGAQARKLMDDELLQNNPEDQYYSALMTDIQNYKDAGKTINTTDVCDSDEIVKKTVNGAECAYVTASYFVKGKDGYTKTYQQYVLRQDEDGKWKILAYEAVKGNGDSTDHE